MPININWDEIIDYHEIPYFTPNAFYQYKYKKIYIHKLVKEYPEYHKYILDHEKEHYVNNTSDNSLLRKIWGDIKIEWKGLCKIIKNKKLDNEIKMFTKEKIKKELDGKNKIHYFITKNLRPDSKFIIILVFLVCIIVGDIIASMFGYDIIGFYSQWIKSKLKLFFC